MLFAFPSSRPRPHSLALGFFYRESQQNQAESYALCYFFGANNSSASLLHLLRTHMITLDPPGSTRKSPTLILINHIYRVPFTTESNIFTGLGDKNTDIFGEHYSAYRNLINTPTIFSYLLKMI